MNLTIVRDGKTDVAALWTYARHLESRAGLLRLALEEIIQAADLDNADSDPWPPWSVIPQRPDREGAQDPGGGMSEIPYVRRIARVGISKKLRFDIFKRDGFKCQYCGTAPSEEVILEVDHIRPVVDGGGNEIDNLVTACSDCNRGKGSALLSNVPQSLEEKAELVREQEAQIRAYYEILEAKKTRKDEEVWSIADIFMECFSDTDIQRSRLSSIKMFLGILDYFEVLEAMEIAVDRMYTRNRAWSYFCGVCWRKIKNANGEE